MCEEVFEMICSMDRRKVELQLVLQCAPTIAGLKTSNLLIVPRDLEDKVRFVLRHSGLLGTVWCMTENELFSWSSTGTCL